MGGAGKLTGKKALVTRSPFFVTQQVVRHMLGTRWGAICNLSSVHGFQGARSIQCMRPLKAPSLAPRGSFTGQ